MYREPVPFGRIASTPATRCNRRVPPSALAAAYQSWSHRADWAMAQMVATPCRRRACNWHASRRPWSQARAAPSRCAIKLLLGASAAGEGRGGLHTLFHGIDDNASTVTMPLHSQGREGDGDLLVAD